MTAGVLLHGTPARAQIEAQPDFERKTEEGDVPAAPSMSPPRLIHRVDPSYPPAALSEGRKGVVVLRITLDEQGQVQRVDVDTSAAPDLDDAALGAACGFGFEPGRVDGQPVAAAVIYKQVFTFQDAPPVVTAPRVETPLPPALEAEPTAVVEAPVNFRGLIREMGTKDVLAEAEVSVVLDDETVLSTTTDARGRFELRGIPKGTALVKVAHTNHEVFTSLEEFSDNEVLEARYFLLRRSYNRFETIIRDRTPPREVNRISLGREEVNRVPGTFGDPIRAIENLPSMAQGPLLGGQLLVRGTPPRSTAVYLDGVQIPQLYHFGLWRSVIHPEFLETIELHPGGFGPRYGRATAGVVDIKSRKLRMEHLRAQADVSFLESGFFVGGPVVIGGGEDNPDLPNPRRITFGAAARRSYLDALIPLALNVATPGSPGSSALAPIYSDYQMKVEWRPLASHTLSLMAFGSDDLIRFRFTIADGLQDADIGIRFQLQFHRLIARWNWAISPRLHNELMMYAGLDSAFLSAQFFNRFQGRESVSNSGINNTGPVFGMRNELRYDLDGFMSFVLGLDYAMSAPQMVLSSKSVGPYFNEPRNEVGETTRNVDYSSQFVVHEPRSQLNLAPYVQVILQPLPRMQLIPGFRFDYFKYAGNTRFFAPTPRFAARWEPVEGTVLKATSGFYEQAPRAFETGVWVGNPKLLPERSFQNTVGIEQRLAPSITVALNGFVNRRTSLIQTDALPINVDVDVGLPIFSGGSKFNNRSEGRVWGVDFLLRHEITPSFYGWIAYTLSKSEVRMKGDKDWRPFNFDQNHIFTAVGQYRVPWHPPFRSWARSGRLPKGIFWNSVWAILCGDLSLGLRFRYITGNPENYLNALLPQDPSIKPPIFVRRFKPYHQVDVRVDYKIAFDLWVVAFSLDVINLTNEQAAQGDIPRIPLLPVFSMSFEI